LNRADRLPITDYRSPPITDHLITVISYPLIVNRARAWVCARLPIAGTLIERTDYRLPIT
jgi:hypothetical protein